MGEASERMTSYQKGDLWVKALSAIAALTVAVVALYSYDHKKTEEIEQRKKEYEVKFFERKMEVYSEMCEVVGIISTKKDIDPADVRRYSELHFGKARLLYDNEVFNASSEYLAVLLEAMKAKPHDHKELIQTGNLLIAECRDSIEKSYPGLNIGLQFSHIVIEETTPVKMPKPIPRQPEK